jgi:hypothetical protein
LVLPCSVLLRDERRACCSYCCVAAKRSELVVGGSSTCWLCRLKDGDHQRHPCPAYSRNRTATRSKPRGRDQMTSQDRHCTGQHLGFLGTQQPLSVLSPYLVTATQGTPTAILPSFPPLGGISICTYPFQTPNRGIRRVRSVTRATTVSSTSDTS